MTRDRRDDDQPAGPTRPGPEQDTGAPDTGGHGMDAMELADALDAMASPEAPAEPDDDVDVPVLDPAAARVERLVAEAARGYRSPPPAPVEAMWARIEAAHFGPALLDAEPDAGRLAAPAVGGGARDDGVVDLASRRPPVVRGLGGRRHVGRWGGPALGLAAGLLLGVGIGAGLWRQAATPGATAVAAAPAAGSEAAIAAAAARTDPAYQTVAVEYFDQAVALLASLPSELDEGRPDARLAMQARDLLSTTRLLLDSEAAGSDPQLQALLDDLELVLAQVVRLPAGRDSTQSALINEALQTRDVLPRLRTAAAQVSSPINTRSGDD
jgi:hypothetical protein